METVGIETISGHNCFILNNQRQWIFNYGIWHGILTNNMFSFSEVVQTGNLRIDSYYLIQGILSKGFKRE